MRRQHVIRIKESAFLERNFDGPGFGLDLSVRQYGNGPRVIYLGQASRLITFYEKDLDAVYQWLQQAKTLELS